MAKTPGQPFSIMDELEAIVAQLASSSDHEDATSALFACIKQAAAESVQRGQESRFRQLVEQAVVQKSLSSGKLSVRLRALACVQALALLSLEAASEGEEDDYSSIIPVKDAAWKRFGMGMVTVLCRRLQQQQHSDSSSPIVVEALAALSLTSALLNTRPATLPALIPAMIARLDGPAVSASLEHVLKALLMAACGIPHAEPFTPLIMEAVERLDRRAAGGPSSLGKRGGPSERQVDVNEEEEEDLLLSSASNKRRRALPPALDLTRFPLSIVIEMVIGSLQYVAEDTLRPTIEAWRPSVTGGSAKQPGEPASIAPTQQPPRIDPRRRREDQPAQPSAEPQQQQQQQQEASLTPEQLLERIKFIIFERIVERGNATVRRYNQQPGFTTFLGRLFLGVEVFGVDCFGAAAGTAAGKDARNILAHPSILLPYLQLLWFCGFEQEYRERSEQAMADIAWSDLPALVPGLPLINYDSLASIIKRHIMNAATEQDITLLLTLSSTLITSRPRDGWSGLRGVLVDACRSDNTLLRSIAVLHARDIVDGDCARAILFHVDEMEGEGEGEGESATGTLLPGQRMDLALAMSGKDPTILPAILSVCGEEGNEALRRYLLAKLPVLVDTLAPSPLLPDLVDATVSRHADFWVRLLGLKWPDGFDRAGILLHIINKLQAGGNVAPWIMLLVGKRDALPADAALPLLDLALRDCRAAGDGASSGSQHQLALVIEYLVTCVPPEHLLLRSLNHASPRRAIEAVMLCLTLAKTFRPPVIMAAIGAALDGGGGGGHAAVLYRALLQAITIHGPAVSAFAVTALTRLASTDRPWTPAAAGEADDRWPVFLKAVRLLLPHSLNLLATALPQGVLEGALGREGELRRPVRDYLYQQPPSVRARYQPIMRIIDLDGGVGR